MNITINLFPAGGYDVWDTSEEHLMTSPEDDAIDFRIIQCSPEAKCDAPSIHQILHCADVSVDPFYSKDTSYKFHTDNPNLYPVAHNGMEIPAELTHFEDHFDNFHAVSPHILPRLHLEDGTPDPYNPEESSPDHLDGIVLKVEEILPYSMDDDCLALTPGPSVHQNVGEHLFPCSECGKCFTNESYLTCHERVHTAASPYPCLEFGKGFVSEPQLTTHVINHTGALHYSCSECGKSFLHKRNIARHLRHHTGERPYVCSECGQYFMQKVHLTRHLKVHTGEKPYMCSECGQYFMQKGHLTRHLKVHTGEKPFLCSECGKSFPRKDTYINHQQIHMDKKMYSCTECGKGFALRGMLIIHQRTHTMEKPTKSERGTSLKATSQLQVHQSVHTVEKIFSCPESEKSDLVRYQGVHFTEKAGEHGKGFSLNVSPVTQVLAKEKPFSCLECGKCYRQKRHLLTHQRIHTGKLPYKCSECGKCFNEKRYLVNHQRNHIGERPFSCSECGKSFTWKESLIRHKKFHSGVRPHACSECGKCFTQRGDLLRHHRTHMDKFLFSC
ncbi:PREDICTED: gastrula zinc finger protein XlCGF57.1-like [Nanorana parkeri]|uniref:gastrula zinc finger protein XlCGF57.1-like n=1 Tax=Nanorana parkeri TaxID=125878 RepID=UPI0008547900|nr:PREDICTED: gastrula zinc finger protein XlCGF57.1-like [Nanorana parkeri]